MALLNEIENLWTEKEEDMVEAWVNKLVDNKAKVIEAGKKFREWTPLHVYLSVTRVMKPNISFSLRYLGQEVADIMVNNGDVKLKISSKTAKTNKRYFVDFDKSGTFPWQGTEAAEFRKLFQNIDPEKNGKIEEHRIESIFLKQMEGDKNKFAGTLQNIQAVKFADCPFQFPLPLSGSAGVPKATKGNIDILARRGVGKGTNISIWELKKPETTANAIEQAYIYAVTLIKMLRSKSGGLWYNEVIGFKGAIPAKLTIESVVAVSFESEKKKSNFVAEYQKFKQNNSPQIGDDIVKLYVAFYEENSSEKTLRVDLHEI